MSEQVKADGVEVREREWEESGTSATCEFTSDEPVVTEADALRKGQIDTTVWYVKRMRIGSHEVSMKLRHATGRVDARGNPTYVHTPIKKSNWKVSLHLERIHDQVRRDALDRLYDRLGELSREKGRRAKSASKTLASGRHLVEMGFYDVHFGALIWSQEAYENSNLRDQEDVFACAVDDAIDRVGRVNIDRWVFPVGNDGLHFDNLISTTTGGTRQDADSRYAKVLVAYETATIKAIDRMLEVAPVDVVTVCGNHDKQSTHAIGRILNAYYHRNSDVRVDTQPRPRKYYRYGRTVVGYAHGNEEPISELTRLMPLEVPGRIWGETACHEFHVGHWHKSKKVQTVDTDEQAGIRVWVNPSLKATDAWHYSRGFVGARRAGRCYVYERDDAFVGMFEFGARSKERLLGGCGIDVIEG